MWMVNSNLKKLYNNGDQMILNNISNNHPYFFDNYTKIDILQKIFYITSSDIFFNPLYYINNDIGLKVNKGTTGTEIVIKNNEKIKPCILHGASAINLEGILQPLGYKAIEGNKINYVFKFGQMGNILSYLIKINIFYQILIILGIIYFFKYWLK